jgi:hypothetical protein
MLDFLALALSQNTNPFALAGYIGLGVYATSTWRAFKYGLLWGLTIQIFVLALGKTDILDWAGLALETALRLAGALIITMAVHYLYRMMRRGGGSGGSGPDKGPTIKRKPPHLRQVK